MLCDRPDLPLLLSDSNGDVSDMLFILYEAAQVRGCVWNGTVVDALRLFFSSVLQVLAYSKFKQR